MSDEELNTERTYKNVTMTFREPEYELPETVAFTAVPSLSPEERALRMARFDCLVALLQSFEAEFDGAAYRYSELLAEAKTRIEQEMERIKPT